MVRRVFRVVGRAQGAWPAAPLGLVGAADRAGRRLARMPGDERAAVRALLDGAPTPHHRAAYEAAVRAGHQAEALGRFVDLVDGTPTQTLGELLDPLPQHLRQRSRTTCGSACLLVARALADPVYALWLLGGVDARAGAVSRSSLAERFGAAEQGVKKRTNAVVGPAGVQLPWPPTLGTSPWGAAAEMTRFTGERYRARYLDPDSPQSRAAGYDALDRAVASGLTAPLFVGSSEVPRHVVLAVARDADALRLYEPASGAVVALQRAQLVDGGLRVAGWTVPWAVAVPA